MRAARAACCPGEGWGGPGRAARGGRKAEVTGLPSHAQPSAAKRPAPCPDLEDSRFASQRGRVARAQAGAPALGLRRSGPGVPRGEAAAPAPAPRAGPGKPDRLRPPFRTPTSAWDPPELPGASGPPRGTPATLARAPAARAGPGSGRARGGAPQAARASAPRLASAAGLPPTLALRGLPPTPYLAPGPGASSSRGRRGPARAEGRGGDRGSRGRRPARLPRFRPSQELNIPPLRPAPMRKTVAATAPPTSECGTAGPLAAAPTCGPASRACAPRGLRAPLRPGSRPAAGMEELGGKSTGPAARGAGRGRRASGPLGGFQLISTSSHHLSGQLRPYQPTLTLSEALGIRRDGRLLQAPQQLIIWLGRAQTWEDISRR